MSIECQYWSLAVDSFGDYHLGDYNETLPPPKISPASQNPPPVPKRPSVSTGNRTSHFNELDRRVPLQKVKPPQAPVRTPSNPGTLPGTSNISQATGGANGWNCSSCTFTNHIDLDSCEVCHTKRLL